MAAYIPVPRDLTRVKAKVFLNLTKRQLVCFSAAALLGVPFFFWVKRTGNVSLAAFAMIFVMLPLFFLALYEKNGQPLEVLAKHYILARFIRPKLRPYRTDNYYDALMRQYELEQEVKAIVFQKNKRAVSRKKRKGRRGKAHTKAEKGDQSGSKTGKAGKSRSRDGTAVHPL